MGIVGLSSRVTMLLLLLFACFRAIADVYLVFMFRPVAVSHPFFSFLVREFLSFPLIVIDCFILLLKLQYVYHERTISYTSELGRGDTAFYVISSSRPKSKSTNGLIFGRVTNPN